MPSTPSRRRGVQIVAALLIAVALFFGLGEILARSLNLVDRLNDFPRQLYQATDDEELPYVLRPSLDTTARGRRIVIDENRMRVSPDAAEPTPDAKRILVLGDSVAFGYRLPFDDTLGAQLQRELDARTGRPHTVLNGGVEGYNSQNQLAWLRSYGWALDPDEIVVVFNLNDYDYGPVMGPNGILTTDRTQRVSTWSLANISDFYVLLRWLGKLGAHTLTTPSDTSSAEGEDSSEPAAGGQRFDKFDRYVSLLRKQYYAKPSDGRWEDMVDALRGMRDDAAEHGVPLWIVIVPDGDQVGVDEPDLVPQERLAQICRDEDLRCIDLLPSFQLHEGDTPLFIDIMHPNAIGHEIVARELAIRLEGASP